MDARPARSPRAAAVVLLIATLTACAAPAAVSSGTSTLGPSATAAQLLAGTQGARADAGVAALTDSTCGTAAAQQRAEALVGSAELIHAPLDAVMSDCGVSTAGENLSRASVSPDDVVTAWMGSPGHRANILDPTYTQIGVACVPDGPELLCSEVFLGP